MPRGREVGTVERKAVKRLRDSHHAMARLFALGMRPGEVAFHSGYCLSRVSILYSDPAFRQLIEDYRQLENEAHAEARNEYFDNVISNRNTSARLIRDKLEMVDDPDDISFRELSMIHADSADRTGYGKHSIQTNVNLDFADMLAKAIGRSDKVRKPMLVIDNTPGPEAPLPQPPSADFGVLDTSPRAPRRRA